MQNNLLYAKQLITISLKTTYTKQLILYKTTYYDLFLKKQLIQNSLFHAKQLITISFLKKQLIQNNLFYTKQLITLQNNKVQH